jgi:hypothetical protein
MPLYLAVDALANVTGNIPTPGTEKSGNTKLERVAVLEINTYGVGPMTLIFKYERVSVIEANSIGTGTAANSKSTASESGTVYSSTSKSTAVGAGG